MGKCDPNDKKCLERKSKNIAFLIAIVVIVILFGTGCGCLYSSWKKVTGTFGKITIPLLPKIGGGSIPKCPKHECPTCPPAPTSPPLVKCDNCPACPTCEKCTVCTKCPKCPDTKPCAKCKKADACSDCKLVVHMALATQCPKCNTPDPKNVCNKCGACSACKVDDKCGVCQRFERQVCLHEQTRPCTLCGQKPCKCPNASGTPVIKEPCVARNGVFSDLLSNMIYI